MTRRSGGASETTSYEQPRARRRHGTVRAVARLERRTGKRQGPRSGGRAVGTSTALAVGALRIALARCPKRRVESVSGALYWAGDAHTAEAGDARPGRQESDADRRGGG